MSTDDNIDFSGYEQLFKDADKDNLVGKHNFMVTAVLASAWDDGRERFDISGHLNDVGGMRFSFSISALDTPTQIRDEADAKIKKSKTLNALHWASLSKLGLRPDKLKQGDEFQVDLYREKPKAGYDVGFLRLRKIVGPVRTPMNVKDDAIPF